jgi:uncharacterized protein YydD (DUF2326 family)
MRLSKIYANNDNFKPITFSGGLNVIYGDIEENNTESGKVKEHNLGKTSLVYLLDFMLLKEVKKGGFFYKHKEKFSDWIFFLEIELNSGEFLTIRRSVNPSTKVSFKKHFSKGQNFIDEINWDHKELPVKSKKKEKSAKLILEQEYLKFNVAPHFSYRSFLSYLLRTQKDYNHVFNLENFFSHKDWKPLLFSLLGLNYELLDDKYRLDTEAEEEGNFIKKLSGQGNSKEVNKIKAAIEAKDREKKELQEKIDEFNFFQKEESINFDLVKNVESEISRLNKEEYSLNYSIEQIRNSLDSSNKPNLDFQDLESLFSEVKIFFPDQLKKEYHDVLNFSDQITKEREKYLKDELKELESRLVEIKKELNQNNQKRMNMLSLLKEKDTFIKYKQYQEDIIKIESEIISYKSKLDNAKTIESYQKSLDATKDRIKEVSASIKDEIDKDSVHFQDIRKIFQDIYKKSFEYTALLVLTPNSSGNVEFETPVIDQSEDLTGQGDGYTSTRVLCASFVLAILVHYSNQSYYRFAYHDGILESWGDNHKINFIKTVRNYCSQNNLQYIISIIKSDVPNGFDFDTNEIKRTLSKGDELFGSSF